MTSRKNGTWLVSIISAKNLFIILENDKMYSLLRLRLDFFFRAQSVAGNQGTRSRRAKRWRTLMRSPHRRSAQLLGGGWLRCSAACWRRLGVFSSKLPIFVKFRNAFSVVSQPIFASKYLSNRFAAFFSRSLIPFVAGPQQRECSPFRHLRGAVHDGLRVTALLFDALLRISSSPSTCRG